ncbi:hypothetical protein J3458_015697 [Metarhizium acridum]|uniref:uncharacterized protein n=1 Tax=Metarhizium acridum TaxID=92637 RepID=UPI001C6B06B5|nr:hypothetical protein J3458_015697 [Metarhizium acridum]
MSYDAGYVTEDEEIVSLPEPLRMQAASSQPFECTGQACQHQNQDSSHRSHESPEFLGSITASEGQNVTDRWFSDKAASNPSQLIYDTKDEDNRLLLRKLWMSAMGMNPPQ